MTSNESLDQLTKRPIQYWFEDGIGELVTGGLFSLIGVYFVLQATIAHPGWLAALSILSVFFIGGGVILGRSLIGKLKERLVYPHTGYVAYAKRPTKRKRILALSITIAIFTAVNMLGRTQNAFDWTPLIIGIICGALMLYQAYQAALFRLYLEAALAGLIGVTVALLGSGDFLSSGIFFVVYGLVLILGGGCTLRSYLKNTPIVVNPEEI